MQQCSTTKISKKSEKEKNRYFLARLLVHELVSLQYHIQLFIKNKIFKVPNLKCSSTHDFHPCLNSNIMELESASEYYKKCKITHTSMEC